MIRTWLGELFERFTRKVPVERSHKPLPPHPANVPGTFYVEDGCCISCGVWEDVAPDLLAWLPDGSYSHCFVARQPETDEELSRMMDAMHFAEVDCIRARSCRPDWAERLRNAGLGDQIDPD